jgi:hypothetical protein
MNCGEPATLLSANCVVSDFDASGTYLVVLCADVPAVDATLAFALGGGGPSLASWPAEVESPTSVAVIADMLARVSRDGGLFLSSEILAVPVELPGDRDFLRVYENGPALVLSNRGVHAIDPAQLSVSAPVPIPHAVAVAIDDTQRWVFVAGERGVYVFEADCLTP